MFIIAHGSSAFSARKADKLPTLTCQYSSSFISSGEHGSAVLYPNIRQQHIDMSSFPCKICVEKLQVRANAGVDAWGRRRAQPTFISIDISLRNYPAQAANADAIDQSTIHYGTLSKSVAEAVSAAVTKWSSTDDLIALVHRSAVPFPNDIGAVQISVLYPKASKYGDGIRISRSISIANSAILQLVDIRIPTLIGVNKHEREAKQPLVINIWIEMFNLQCAERHQELEDRLVKVALFLPPTRARLTE